jgi:nitroreductase
MDQRWKGNPENERLSVLFCANEAGAIAQNVYLEATSLGLATVFVGGFNKKEITDLLRLKEETIFLVMPIGCEAAVK